LNGTRESIAQTQPQDTTKTTTFTDSINNATSNSTVSLSQFSFFNNNRPTQSALERFFGTGGVQVTTRGFIELGTGWQQTSTNNPALPQQLRRRNRFDLTPQIQLNVNARVGDKINFDMDYNTDATFDFNARRLRLAYQGDEDEIIRNIEVGNVSITSGNSLIDGGTALFGIKSDLQFGRLRVSAILSQQESERQTITSRGGVQTTPFEFQADQYDENRHFFLGYYFRDHYDHALSRLPYIQSSISITRMEVWVTNRRGNFDQVRNIVAFADLGEHNTIHNPMWTAQGIVTVPQNDANNLYNELTTTFVVARNIHQASTVFPANIVLGMDYERIENARLLAPTEYTFQPQLGYISLRAPLQTDEVLAVAFEFTYNGQVYQVGEFSNNINTEDNGGALFAKLLKPVSLSPESYTWHLMMKNIYTISHNAHNVQREGFRMNITYQSDTTGVYLSYIPDGRIADELLLRVMNLDNLNSRNDPFPDGIFDFLDGFTIDAQNGRIIFPVVEPFGSHLRKMFDNDFIADRYVFQELYDSTRTVARQIAEKNKFRMNGEFRGSSGSEINLNAMNVARGSVRVTANGITLTEGVDYTVDYISGTVTIINQSIIDSGTPVSISLENQSLFNMQRRTMMGLNLSYDFTRDFSVGATIMHYRERPLTPKTGIGNESVRNTLWGTNLSYRRESYLITNLIDRLPFVNATAPSSFSTNLEFAHIIPGHYRSGNAGSFSYIDDFEAATSRIDLRQPNAWSLASTPLNNTSTGLFPEAALSNDIAYGKNRAHLAWFFIDGIFTRRNSHLTPAHIRNDLDQLSDNRVREIFEREIFPNRELSHGQAVTITPLNLSFYPNRRGSYNLDTNVDTDGFLLNPRQRWGGMMRRLETRDFEAANIEYIEFWLLDPFANDRQGTLRGGDLYFNLGDISEDILKDGKKFFENGLPVDGDESAVGFTVWGKYPLRQSTVFAFDNSLGMEARRRQDVGLNGLSVEEEKLFPTYANFLNDLKPRLSNETLSRMEDDAHSPLNSPANDLFRHFRGVEQDLQQMSILDRYKFFNNTEGNSTAEEDVNFPSTSRSTPDAEGVAFEVMNENEAYYQYRISLRPEDMVVGRNFIVDKREASVRLRNGEEETVRWYQFKIPIRDFQTRVGNIRGFNSIRFMRIFLTDFEEDVFLRFATLDLVRSEWRNYTQDLVSGGALSGMGTLDISTVNIEENSDRTPVNYVLPPGVSRTFDPSQPQLRQENEQSLVMRVQNIEPDDSRAIFKNTLYDFRRYKRLQMFVHAARLPTDDTLQDNDLSIFIRIGSDFRNNFYEYEIPLRLTPPGRYNTHILSDQEAVWRPENMFDFPLELLTNLKLNRNAQRGHSGESAFRVPYSEADPEKPHNLMTIVGNPSLAEVKVMMIGIRNHSNTSQSGEVWVNELRLSDFDERGGWAAQGNVNLALSDIGMINVSGRRETVGFGALNQSLLERRNDDFSFINIAFNLDLGRFLPERARISAPFFYSFSSQTATPQYDPFNQDISLSKSLKQLQNQHQRDSVKQLSLTKTTNRSFSLNNLNINIRSRNPMPYDLANFSFGYAQNDSRHFNPEIEYANIRDFRLRVNYNYTPSVRPIEPFRNREVNPFLKSVNFNYLPNNIQVSSNLMRNYQETQLRDLNAYSSGVTQTQRHLLSFSQNFLWDRGFSVVWDLTRSLRTSFRSGTVAEIEEPYLQVNRDINRNDYEVWRDSVWLSIRQLGKPLNYEQTTNVTYTLPFAQISALNWISTSAAYNSRYRWERGAIIRDRNIGNFIQNDMSITFNNRLNIASLYNKNPFLREKNQQSGAWRTILMLRSLNINFGYKTRTDIPGFDPMIGDVFGQKSIGGGLVPGLGFAFGFDNGERYIEKAMKNNWLVINQNNITPALFNQTRNLCTDATLEPLPGLRINLNALYENNQRTEIRYMHEGMPKIYGGSFAITTLSIASAFENSTAKNNYRSAAFEKFLENRHIVSSRVRKEYEQTNYPSSGFLTDSPFGGQSFDRNIGDINHNAADVLIPAFLAAYTGGNANSVALTAFPKLSALKPNWDISYNLMTVFPQLQGNFNSFMLTHRYISQYRVGASSSFLSWVSASDGSGLGYIRDVVSGAPIPSMPYDISTVSIVESFIPLIEARSEFINNLSASFRFNKTRVVNLNIPSQRIVEMNDNDFVIGFGYRIPNFNRIVFRNSERTSAGDFSANTLSFSNDLNLRLDISNKITHALIRQIDNGFTQATGGLRSTSIRFSADYAMSEAITLRAFFDRMMNQPLVSASSYAMTSTNAGVSLRFWLR
jgi:cell surface protein SprA